MNVHSLWKVVLLLSCVCALPVAAQVDGARCELVRLADPAGLPDNDFGATVSIDGGYAVVGDSGDIVLGENSGSVTVYRHDGSDWVEDVKLTASDGSTDDYFGVAVSISGERLIVGAPGAPGASTNDGCAYIFRRDGPAWVEEAKIFAADGEYNDAFGGSVAISDDVALAGYYRDDDLAFGAGAAYVFQRSGTAWSEADKLFGSGTDYGDWFGWSVATDGTWCAVGARDDDPVRQGAVYLFRNLGLGWVEHSVLTASDGTLLSRFGSAVDIDGDRIVVGADNADGILDDEGAAYVYEHSGTSWVETQKLLASDFWTNRAFGNAVAISGDRLLVGQPGLGDGHGAAYIFSHDGAAWVEDRQLRPFDNESYNACGRAVALSGEYGIIGAPCWTGPGDNPGKAYIYGFSVGVCGTCAAEFTCTPAAGTLPFTTLMQAYLFNLGDTRRQIDGRLNVAIAGGGTITNWRGGYTNIEPNAVKVFNWDQVIPAVGSMVGDSVFTLVVEDVTPAPYNQPPYPAAGSTDTDTVVLTGIIP